MKKKIENSRPIRLRNFQNLNFAPKVLRGQSLCVTDANLINNFKTYRDFKKMPICYFFDPILGIIRKTGPGGLFFDNSFVH